MSSKRAPLHIASLVERLDQLGLLLRSESRGLDRSDLVISAPCTHDSRQVLPGGAFVAIAGARADGATFAAEALRRGAALLISEPAGVRSIAALGPEVAEVPLIAVSNARRALAETCAWWEGDPAEELAVIGVTGTDGKTTTSTYLSTALSAAGLSSGLISTALQRVGGREEPMAAHQTTWRRQHCRRSYARSLQREIVLRCLRQRAMDWPWIVLQRSTMPPVS